MARLNFRPDGHGSVSLTLTDDAGNSIGVVVTEAYLRARAWAILNDLDPAEAQACRSGAVTVDQVGDEEVAAADVEINPGPIQQRDTVLLAIASGTGTATETAKSLRLSRSSVTARVTELIDRGLVQALRVGRGRGSQSVYGLTRDGVIRSRRLGLSIDKFAQPSAALLEA